MRKIFKIVVLTFLAYVLSGCSINNGHNAKKTQNEYNVAMLSRRLSDYNVRVFHGINSLKLILLNKDFFVKDSANFTGHAYEALNFIYSLSSYHKESTVAVTGYYRGNGEGYDKTLAIERARKVSHHLWQSKISSNFVYASGDNATFANSRTSCTDCVLLEFSDFLRQ